MTGADLDLESRQPTGQDRLTPAQCTGTVEATPAVWSLPAAVAWRLSHHPSKVVSLREPFPTGNDIVQGTERLRRLKLLGALARENGKTIETAIRELFEALRAEKMTVVDDDLRAVPSPKFSRIPAPHLFVESRIGQRNVGIARAEVLQWADDTALPPLAHAATEPAETKETKAEDVQQTESLSPLAAVQDRPNQGGRPPLPYKKEVIEKTLAWLDEEGKQPQAEIIRFMNRIVSKIDDQGGPCNTTLKTWAKDILDEARRQRSEIVETSTG